MSGLVDEVAKIVEANGVDWAALGLGWARVAPAVTIVPAFGLRAIPAAARTMMGLAFAASIAPAVKAHAPTGPWLLALIGELARGVPFALSIAVPLWTATMVGGTIDSLRGAQETNALAVVEGPATPLGSLFSMLASLAFLASGGPSRVVLAAASLPDDLHAPIVAAMVTVVAGIGVAVAIAAPVVAAAVVIEVALALLAKSSSPTNVQALVGLLRGVAVLCVTGLLFERISAAVETLASR